MFILWWLNKPMLQYGYFESQQEVKDFVASWSTSVEEGVGGWQVVEIPRFNGEINDMPFGGVR